MNKHDDIAPTPWRRGHVTTDGVHIYDANEDMIAVVGVCLDGVEVRHVSRRIVDCVNGAEDQWKEMERLRRICDSAAALNREMESKIERLMEQIRANEHD